MNQGKDTQKIQNAPKLKKAQGTDRSRCEDLARCG